MSIIERLAKEHNKETDNIVSPKAEDRINELEFTVEVLKKRIQHLETAFFELNFKIKGDV